MQTLSPKLPSRNGRMICPQSSSSTTPQLQSRPAPPQGSPFFHPSTPTTTKTIKSPGGTTTLKIKKSRRQSSTGNYDDEEAKSSILGTCANLTTTIVGSGIVGIPFAVQQSGLVAGTIMIALCGILTDKSLRLLIETGKHIDVPSYETLMEAVFGRVGFVFISINMFLSSFGAMVSYLIIIKDTIPSLCGVAADNEPVRRGILVVCSMGVTLPLSMQRDMANLSNTSVISAVFDTIMVIIIAVCAPVRESVELSGGWYHVVTHSTIHFETIFVGLGVLSFAFVCQDSCFIIAGSLSNPTKERWAVVTTLSLVLCSILSLACGVTGYLAFQHDTAGNVLNNFDDPSTRFAAMAARALLGSTMFFCYPLASYVVRHVLVVLLFQGRRAHEGDDSSILARRDRRVALTLAIYLMALVPAIFLNDVGTVLSFAGAIAGSCLSYIGPGVAYLAVHGCAFLVLVDRCFADSCKPFLWGYPDLSEVRTSLLRSMSPASESEMLPLVEGSSVGLPVDDEHNEDGNGLGPSSSPKNGLSYIQEILHSILSFLVWYMFLFPIWCAIAKQGYRRLTDFEKEKALKSPRPNRLGKIMRANQRSMKGLIPPRKPMKQKEFSRHASDPQALSRNVSDPVVNDETQDFARSNNASNLYGATGASTATPIAPYQNGNSKVIAMNIYDSSSSSLSTPSMEKLSSSNDSPKLLLKSRNEYGDYDNDGNGVCCVEPDPQEAVPTAYDFFVAISFSVFGVVALTVGIYSIMVNG